MTCCSVRMNLQPPTPPDVAESGPFGSAHTHATSDPRAATTDGLSVARAPCATCQRTYRLRSLGRAAARARPACAGGGTTGKNAHGPARHFGRRRAVRQPVHRRGGGGSRKRTGDEGGCGGSQPDAERPGGAGAVHGRQGNREEAEERWKQCGTLLTTRRK